MAPDSILNIFSGGFLLVVVIVFAAVWILQFVALMSLPDDRFPGQHARLAWVAAFLVIWVLAPIAFLLWARSTEDRRSAVVKARRERPARTEKPTT